VAPARRILIVDDETHLRIPPSDIPSEDGGLRRGTHSSPPRPRRNRLTANRSSCDVPELVQRSPFEGVLIATRLARHAG